MRKIIYLLLLTPIIYLASCSKSNVTPQSLEDVLIGKEWCLSNENKGGFLLAEDGKFYLTQKCQSNTHIGNWEIEGDVIKYKYTSNSQDTTVVLGRVTEYKKWQIKLLDYTDPNAVKIYVLDLPDVFGCMDSTSANYNPAAECNGSCLQIGDFHQGGIIFWLNSTGDHGLVCDIKDLGRVEWGCYPTAISGASETAIGTGDQNTDSILAGCLTFGIAADLCVHSTSQGYPDWFLPSKDELTEMYLNQGTINSTAVTNGGVSFKLTDPYWSSSESDKFDAWFRDFWGGFQSHHGKFNTYYVRAVRAF